VGVPRELNELMVANYIAQNFIDRSATFYKNIYRLDPGHTMTVSKRGTSRRCYWALDPSREVRLPSDEAYAEALREIFTRAVRCRLRSAFPVASELSGGLDSSSIVCIARELLLRDGGQPLHTFSAIFNQTPCADERQYLEAVLANGGVKPHFLEVERMDPLADLDLCFQELDEPFWVPALYIHRAFFRLARDHGARVMLSGFDGDNAIGYGESYISDLSRRGRLISAFKEASAYARHSNQSRWHFVRFYAIKPWVPRRLLALVRPAQPGQDPIDLIASEFARRIDYAARMARQAQLRGEVEETRWRQWQSLTGGFSSHQCEVLNKAASHFSIESRHPFFDRRLLDFCLAVPAGQKLKNGFIRSILRRALNGTLPELVRWRVDKANMKPAIVEALRRPGDRCVDWVMQNKRQSLGKYINLGLLDEGYARLQSGGAKTKSDYSIWGPITLARWLQLYEEGQTWESAASHHSLT
jgi:asparagine synthase (glutamine-hydrolysing)